jgi:hypothetical protein
MKRKAEGITPEEAARREQQRIYCLALAKERLAKGLPAKYEAFYFFFFFE